MKNSFHTDHTLIIDELEKSIKFHNFGFIRSISYSFGMASLPMVILFITGSFGGYFSEDLSLFSLLTNRIKGFFIAIAMLSMAYLILKLG